MVELDNDFTNPLNKNTKFQISRSLFISMKNLILNAAFVLVEKIFSSAGFIVNKFKSSLVPGNVNGLVCLPDWLK